MLSETQAMARDTKSYPCRLYGKSTEKDRESMLPTGGKKNENKNWKKKTDDADSSTGQFYEELDEFSLLNFLH
jgi:hypothetical protein